MSLQATPPGGRYNSGNGIDGEERAVEHGEEELGVKTLGKKEKELLFCPMLEPLTPVRSSWLGHKAFLQDAVVACSVPPF